MESDLSPTPPRFGCEQLTLKADGINFYMVARPPYCDRGNFQVFADSEPKPHRANIDVADGWPRYYFSFPVALAEIDAWLTKRKLEVVEPWHIEGTGGV